MNDQWSSRCALCAWESGVFDDEADMQAATMRHFLDAHPDVDFTGAHLRPPNKADSGSDNES